MNKELYEECLALADLCDTKLAVKLRAKPRLFYSDALIGVEEVRAIMEDKVAKYDISTAVAATALAGVDLIELHLLEKQRNV